MLHAGGATLTDYAQAAAKLALRVLRALDGDGVKVHTAEVRRPTLDDVFLHLTGRSLRDGDSEE